MATTPMGTERQERCDDCDRDTPHDVRIELRAESESPGENAAFSREPYRVTTCRRCETSRARRMNDA